MHSCSPVDVYRSHTNKKSHCSCRIRMGPHSRFGLGVCTNDATHIHIKRVWKCFLFLGENRRTPNLVQNNLRELRKKTGLVFLLFLFSCFFFFFFLILFIYLILAVLGLRFCARAFSSYGTRGPLFIAVRGPLTIAASLVAEHRLQTRRLSNCGSRA